MRELRSGGDCSSEIWRIISLGRSKNRILVLFLFLSKGQVMVVVMALGSSSL